jgi:hypothetical protein
METEFEKIQQSSGTTTLNWHARLVLFRRETLCGAANYHWTVY